MEYQVYNLIRLWSASKVMFKIGKLFGLPIKALKEQYCMFKKSARCEFYTTILTMPSSAM